MVGSSEDTLIRRARTDFREPVAARGRRCPQATPLLSARSCVEMLHDESEPASAQATPWRRAVRKRPPGPLESATSSHPAQYPNTSRTFPRGLGCVTHDIPSLRQFGAEQRLRRRAGLVLFGVSFPRRVQALACRRPGGRDNRFRSVSAQPCTDLDLTDQRHERTLLSADATRRMVSTSRVANNF